MIKSYSEQRIHLTPVPTATLRLRPDQALFHLAVSVEVDGAAAALPLLRRPFSRLEELLPSLAPGAKLVMTDFDLPNEPGKLSSAVARMQARLTVPLPEAPFWERAQRVAAVDDALRGLALEGKKQKPAVEVRRELPSFTVSDPESHRGKLVERVHERARALAGGQPILLRDLRFERLVEQRSLGLDEVELSLSVDGTAELTLK